MEIFEECKDKMNRSIEALKSSFSTLRAGRVTAGLLDKVVVNCYGENMPLKNVASINSISPTDLQVKPFDPSTARDILGGINKADLGCTVSQQTGALVLKFPAPSEERRQELIKQAKRYAEDGKVNVSARSLGDVNVQIIMEKLGGGGHHSMAGAQIADTTSEEVVKTIKEIIKTS